MALFRSSDEFPKASTRDVTVMAVAYDSSRYEPEDGASKQWLDVQVLQTPGANENLPRQTNPHLSYRKGKDGERANTGVPYSIPAQMDKIKEAAGDNVFPVNSKDGDRLGSAYVFNGDVVLNTSKDGHNRPPIVNTKALSPIPNSLKLPDDPVSAQFYAVRDNVKAAREAKKAREVEKQQEGPEASSSDTPSFIEPSQDSDDYDVEY